MLMNASNERAGLLIPSQRILLTRIALWSAAAGLLAAPAIAMIFTDAVQWDAADFLAAALLLAGIGLTIEHTIRHIHGSGLRILAIAATLAIGLLIWADAAVGVF
jgi:hypothetical protein